MKTQTNIGIKLQIEGFHNFPNASEIFGEKVSFLEVRHRHMFGVEMKLRVTHDNRDKEFILLKREVENYFERNFGKPAEFGAQSCESIARNLLEAYDAEYVQVNEDDENYAEIFKIE